MEEGTMRDKMENITLLAKSSSKMIGKLEDMKVMINHINSLSDLLVLKYQSLVDAGTLQDDEWATPILSIAEMLNQKADAALKNLDEIEGAFYFNLGVHKNTDLPISNQQK